MQDRRRTARSRVFLAGAIAGRDGQVARACVVRDLSATGAHLAVDEPSGAPDEVALSLGPGGEVRRARVVWRGPSTVGIAFEAADPRRDRNVIPFVAPCGSDADRAMLRARIARFVR